MDIGTAIRHSVGLVEKRPREASAINAISIPTGGTVSHLSKWEDLPQAYRIHPWLYAAVKAIALAVADVPIIALKLKTKPRYTMTQFKRLHGITRWEDVIPVYKEEEGAEEVPGYWALDALRNPLPEANLTEHDLFQAIVTYLELAGNAYVEKLYSDQNKTKINGFWPRIDPRNMYVVPGDGRLVAGYIFRAGATSKLFKWDEIIHFTYFHPENQYYGLAPVEVLKVVLSADVRANDFNQVFFDNSCVLDGVFSTEQALGPDDIRMWRELFEEQYRGTQRAHKVGIMGKGMQYQPLGQTHRQMGFLDLLQYSREQILGVYGVPPIVLGLYKEVNRAAAKVMRQLFYEQTVIPRLGKIEAALNFALVKPGENVQLVFDLSAIEALREDMELKITIGEGLKDQGYTLNELREYHHKPRAEGPLVDSLVLPLNVQEAGRVAVTASKGKTKAKQLAEEYLPPINLTAQIAVHEGHLPKIFLSGGGRGVDVLSQLGIMAPADWVDDFGFEAAAQAWTKDRVIPLAGQIDDITRERIGALIDKGMDEGFASPDIARSIRGEFSDMSTSRAATIARTEPHGAVGAGQHEVYKQMEIEKHEWISALIEGRTRDWHAKADGQTQLITRPFDIYGPSGAVRMMHPGDPGGGAENVVNCLCSEAPVVGKTFDREVYWKEWADLIKEIEDTLGKKYEKALAAWFKKEGEIFAGYFEERVS